jgi:hypothetical protein
MNFGIITSFVIGGLMLLSILAFNMNMSASTQETTLTTITQQKMNAIVDVLSYDLNRVGYNNNDAVVFNKPILIGNDNEIEFQTADGNVTWVAKKTDKVSSSSNPNDYYLYRKDHTGTSKFPVTYFELIYFDKDGNVIDVNTLPYQSGIRIEVKLIIESEEPTRSNYSTGNDRYHRAVWQRTFVPNNINKPY